MFARLGEAVLSFILLGVVTFISSYAISYFFGSNSEMIIGEAAEVTENNYVLAIDIANYKDYKKTSIEFPIKIDEKNITSSVPINIKQVENNVGINDAVVMDVSNIPPDSNFQLFVSSGDLMDNKDITVIDNSEFQVKYKQDLGNPVNSLIKELFVTAAIYSCVYVLFLLLANRSLAKRKKEMEEAQEVRIGVVREQLAAVQEFSESANKESEKFKTELKELKAESLKLKQDYRKSRILLHSKLNDYQKELNFWRDTVRKILYKLPNNKSTSEEVLKTVTETLGTYQVNERTEHDYEYLKVMGKLLNESEENNRN